MNITIVVQRYGEPVIGGAENLARQLAGRLAAKHHVEVLTSCALEHSSWANHFPEGVTQEDGVTIRRFRVTRRRDWRWFGRFSSIVFSMQRWRILPSWLERLWFTAQGPVCPGLLEHLSEDDSDVVVFFTYLYYPTVYGLPWVANRAVLVPTAHDEDALRLPSIESVFHLPRYLIFLTREEQALVQNSFSIDPDSQQVIGMGIELREPSSADDGYLLYVGRIESAKNCQMMFDYCQRADVQLKAIGPALVKVPDHVEYLGIVSDKKKTELLSHCKALIAPSALESLSISVLEAWAHGKPVIVWDRSPVLKAQVERSGGGYSFADYESFRKIVSDIDPRRGTAGWDFVNQHYSWDEILKKYESVFEKVSRLEDCLE